MSDLDVKRRELREANAMSRGCPKCSRLGMKHLTRDTYRCMWKDCLQDSQAKDILDIQDTKSI